MTHVSIKCMYNVHVQCTVYSVHVKDVHVHILLLIGVVEIEELCIMSSTVSISQVSGTRELLTTISFSVLHYSYSRVYCVSTQCHVQVYVYFK